MKNYLTLVLALAVVSSPAFASRARLESVGQDKNGSYFVDDSRNMFLNPAEISNYKKKLWLEYGSSTAATYNGGQDVYTAPQAQGGFSNTFGDYTYGMYMGRQSDRLLNTLLLANAVAGAGTFIAPDHNLDIFFAGEGSVKWGVDLYWAGAQAKGALNKTANVLAAKLGVTADKLSVFTTLGLSSSSKSDGGTTATTNELKGKFAIDLGATYQMDNMKVKGNFSTFGSTLNQVGTDTVEATTTIMSLGAGWKKEVSKSVSVWTITGLDYEKDGADKNVNANTTVTNATQSWYNLPLTIAAEAQASSWLALRGAVSASILGQNQNGNTKTTNNNQLTVAGGVGMTFGDVQIDGVVGQAATTNGFGYIAPKTPQLDNARFGLGSDMITRLAVTYNF